ncbi:MFS general substrate transporter [Daedalea quercina L-15889]|uniref:MFS general substrate transporter n=1 Tax=Daedalea quercina L-15889 TaxID=1314783 RepID=A0A165QDA2_9APHY|nr:MFS general substrate transporter [Daedalea quercina L-15889]
MSQLDISEYAIELTPAEVGRGCDETSNNRQPFREPSLSVEGTLANHADETNIHELSPIDGGWEAWRFVASAFAMETMIWGYEFSYGIFQDYYTSHPPFQRYSTVSIAAVGTTSIAIQYAETILLSLFFERYPDLLRPSVWVSLGVATLSLLLASFVSQIWLLIALQGVIFGIAGGFLYFPILVLLPQWFVRRRGLATGIIFAGSGLGGFAFPFLLQALLDHYGFRWTLRIWAIVIFVTVGVAILGMQPRLPVPKYPRGQRPRFIPPQMNFLRSTLFWLLSVCTVLHAMSYYSVSLYIATFAKVISSPFSASVVLALFNSSSTVCQIVIGHLCDRFPYVWLMASTTLISGLAVFLLWGFARELTLVFLFAVIYGGFMGGYNSLGLVSASDCAGSKPEQSSIIWACIFFIRGIAVVVGPLISGILYGIGKSSQSAVPGYGGHGFKALEVFVGTCTVAASLSSVMMAITRRKSQE